MVLVDKEIQTWISLRFDFSITNCESQCIVESESFEALSNNNVVARSSSKLIERDWEFIE